MVKLTKTPLPRGVAIKNRDDWRAGTPVREQLDRECHYKCYICEGKSNEMTVDHIRPKKARPDLEFDWDNLLLACKHCNGVKGPKYDGIINPIEIDPESTIALTFAPTGSETERVNIAMYAKADTAADAINITVELLNAVYNEDGTHKLGCRRLREKLREELRTFELYVKHFDSPGYERPIYERFIRENISRSSPFAAFKRKIVRDDPRLSAAFADAL